MKQLITLSALSLLALLWSLGEGPVSRRHVAIGGAKYRCLPAAEPGRAWLKWERPPGRYGAGARAEGGPRNVQSRLLMKSRSTYQNSSMTAANSASEAATTHAARVDAPRRPGGFGRICVPSSTPAGNFRSIVAPSANAMRCGRRAAASTNGTLSL